jgi:hypothetical protein
MAVTLYAYDVIGGRLPGSLTVDGGKITADSLVLERAVLRLVAGGMTAEQAVATLDGQSNGRVIWSVSPPDVPGWLKTKG